MRLHVQVTDLRAQLGAKAVPCPATDIGSSFTAVANKALGIDGFYPYNSDTNFLLGEPLAKSGILAPVKAHCVYQLAAMLAASHAQSADALNEVVRCLFMLIMVRCL